MQRVILIDGYGFVFRAYHSLPPLKNPSGTYVGAVFGFANMLFKVIRNHPNDKIIVVLDSGSKTFRHDIYEAYKANRPPAPEDLIPQFPLVRSAAEAFNLKTVEAEGLEADDLIASLALKAEQNNLPVTIYSSDKDLMQLIRGQIDMFDPMKNKVIKAEQVIEKFGVRPEQMCDYLSLLGDSSDNIPGVKGIGAKTAANLLNQFSNLDDIYNSIDQVEKDRIRNLLIDDKENAYLSYQLINLKNPQETTVNLDEVKAHKLDNNAISSFLNEQGFHALKAKVNALFNVNIDNQNIPANNKEDSPNIIIEEINIENLNKIQQLYHQERVGIFLTPLKKSQLIMFCHKQNCYYYEIKQTEDSGSLFNQPSDVFLATQKAIIQLISDHSTRIITADFKHFLHFIYKQQNGTKLDINATFIDLNLIEYLLPLEDKGKLITKFQEFEKTTDIEKDKVIFAVFEHFNNLDHNLKDLHKHGLLSIYQEVDRRINNILFEMEQIGVAISLDKLRSLSNEFATQINDLTTEIYEISGQEFNIGSPKQLGEILFDKLALETTKKTSKAKSRSTSSDILEDLKAQGHKIAELVLNWRHFSKLKSTYTDALPKNINQNTSRIHTVFNNCLTSTGRLSSSNPNLQNIPIRSNEGDLIRSCFIAKKDHSLIGADYSQIELRLLAHLANAKSLKQAFAEGKDIHRSTASEMFEIAEDQVSDEMRSHSKQINFGIIYGISAFGLAERLNIERKKAKDFIEKYFIKYPEIKSYLDQVLEDCRRDLFVETVIGRKLFFPEINTKNGMIRSFQERAAINAPLQGSASDIIKIAMINIDKELKQQRLRTKLILQVHDELIYEAPEAEKTICADIVKNGMEKAMQLSVPLTVNLATADNWQQLK